MSVDSTSSGMLESLWDRFPFGSLGRCFRFHGAGNSQLGSHPINPSPKPAPNPNFPAPGVQSLFPRQLFQLGPFLPCGSLGFSVLRIGMSCSVLPWERNFWDKVGNLDPFLNPNPHQPFRGVQEADGNGIFPGVGFHPGREKALEFHPSGKGFGISSLWKRLWNGTDKNQKLFSKIF